MPHIVFHSDNKAQRDYPDGALELCSVDPQECFELGKIMGQLADAGYEAVHGGWAQGKFLRLPLVRRKQSGAD